MPSVATRISLLTNLLMAAASAESLRTEDKADYVEKLLEDLLCTHELPAEVREQLASFDPATFDLRECAADFTRDPPMSGRRLLELIAYVALSDGQVAPAETQFIRDLGEALRMAPDEYADLVAEDTDKNSRESFIEMARVPVPHRPK